jgi:hypothetical protein
MNSSYNKPYKSSSRHGLLPATSEARREAKIVDEEGTPNDEDAVMNVGWRIMDGAS